MPPPKKTDKIRSVHLNKSNTVDAEQLLFFLVWPMFSVFYSLLNRKMKGAKNILWLFCIYYGFTLVIFSEGTDSYAYAQKFIEIGRVDLTYQNFFSYLYAEDTNVVDVVEPIISFVLSRFTSNPKFLFATFGLIFGYFYSRNIFYLLEKISSEKFTITSLFILTFSLLCPIWSINGFRFWTATQIYLFGVMPYLMENKKKSILISALSIFVHFSFILPVVLVVVYAFVGVRRNVYFMLFIATTFIQQLDLESLREQMRVLPGLYQNRADSYVNEQVQTAGAQLFRTTNWYIRYNAIFNQLIVYTFLVTIYFQNSEVMKKSKNFMRLFCFALLFYSFANLAALVPQGGRFSIIGNLLVFFLIVIYITYVDNGKLINILKRLSVPILIIIILVSIRRGFDYTGILTLIGNPVIRIFVDSDTPIIDFIK